MLTIAIGFFDGVHLGHRKILEGAELAVTFRNHPLTVLNAAKAPRLVMSFEDRVATIRSCGVRDVIVLDFTPDLAALAPEAFISALRLQLGTPTAFSVRCGANWRFGKNGEGTPDWLRERGIPVEVVGSVEYEGEPISSTRIRECVPRGEIAAANAMMGRRWKVEGSRLKGKGEGAKLGYPTINLSLADSPLFALASSLPLGVYQVEVAGRKAIANFGFAPTFGERAWESPVLEVHLLGEDEERFSDSDSKLRLLPVEFVRFLRPERKFASPDELRAQIAADIATVN